MKYALLSFSLFITTLASSVHIQATKKLFSPYQIEAVNGIVDASKMLITDIAKPKQLRQQKDNTIIKKIDLSDNHIQTLPSFEGYSLQHLTELDLSNNKISDISNICKLQEALPALTALNLSGNKLKKESITVVKWILSGTGIEIIF